MSHQLSTLSWKDSTLSPKDTTQSSKDTTLSSRDMTLSSKATTCNTLQHTATHCSIFERFDSIIEKFDSIWSWMSHMCHTHEVMDESCHTSHRLYLPKIRLLFESYDLQHTATHCNTLQRTATHCSIFERFDSCSKVTTCNTLPHTALSSKDSTLSSRGTARYRHVDGKQNPEWSKSRSLFK